MTANEPCKIPLIYLQALVRERIKDWGAGLCKSLGKKLVELTGVQFECCKPYFLSLHQVLQGPHRVVMPAFQLHSSSSSTHGLQSLVRA